MKNEYLIRMENHDDCVKATDNAGIYYRLFHRPVTARLKNELDCMQFHVPSERMIDYHEHSSGTETFIISQGKFLCNCMGYGFTMGAGDILHIQPWMGHSFIPIEPESRLNIMFMGFDYHFTKTQPRMRIQAGFPGLFETPEFRNKFREENGGVSSRTVPIQVEHPREQIPQWRPADYGIREHEYDGINLKLKIAKYETEGVKEVWNLKMKSGFYCEWDEFLPEYRFLYVTGGKIRCWVKTSAEEKFEFDAVQENIITIPPYTPFGFEVTEDATMYDLDCSARLQDLCEELDIDTDKIKNKTELLKLCKSFDFNCTDVGFKK